MKKIKLLLLIPAFALLASCSKAVDPVRKDLPAGGDAVVEAADQATTVEQVASSVINTLGEASEKYVLHIDGEAKNLPLDLRPASYVRPVANGDQEPEPLLNDVKLNLDAELAVVISETNGSALKLTITDLDVSISEFIDITDLKLALGYQYDSEGAFVYLDLSDPSIKTTYQAIITVMGVDIPAYVRSMIDAILDQGKLRCNVSTLIEAFGGLVSGLIGNFLPMNSMMGEASGAEAAADYLFQGWEFIKVMVLSELPEIRVNSEMLVEYKDYLSIATYGTKPNLDRIGVAFNANNEQLHELIKKASEQPEGEEGEAPIAIPEDFDVEKFNGKVGVSLLVGKTKGQTQGKMTFEELALAVSASYEEKTINLNLSLEASYGSLVSIEAVNPNDYAPLDALIGFLPSVLG